MIMSTWPKDTMNAKVAFYGDPRGPHGVNESWFSNNVIRVTPPWKMLYAGKPIKTMAFHSKCAAALGAALNEIWETCDKDQKTIEKNGLQEFGGTFNYRLIRGSSAISNHSFAIAIDLAPSGNALGVKKGKMPAFAVKAFKDQGFRWGGDYKGRKDWMHFEAVS
jgi:D-alanyl-D-alanine carboxypeptidase